MTPTTQIHGRILFLAANPALVARQIAGEDLDLAACLPLRDDVSTDEITPTTIMLTYDHRLARHAYIGFETGGARPIGDSAVQMAGFTVTVAGRRYGKGSSRESSPLAEQAAGIRLIVAESFERIYRQNCDNIGILTTTDFAILDRIRAGDPIPLETVLEGRDAITQDVIRAGGLLPYSKTRLPRIQGRQTAPLDDRPRSLAEKIIARRQVFPAHHAQPGEGVFVQADWRFSHDYFTGMAAHIMHGAFGTGLHLERPDEIIAFQDHMILVEQSIPHIESGMVPAVQALHAAHRQFAADYPVRAHGQLPGEPGAEGICHAILAERYVLPGQIVVGTDSHTPHAGAFGALGFGAGATDIANSWVTGLIRCRAPEVIRIECEGAMPPDVLARDLVQHLLKTELIRTGAAIGMVFEFGGPAIRAMSTDSRATLTNMVAEMGGFSGIVEPDAETAAFLLARRGLVFPIEDWMRSDPGAPYAHTMTVDCATLRPLVAQPGDPGRSLAIDDLPAPVRIDIAYGGSCTSAKQEDFDRYHAVLRWGLDHGMRVAPGRRLVLQFGSLAVRDHCRAKGYLETFAAAGVELVSPGCGACNNCGPGQTTRPDQISISAINRNFPGRSGPGPTWLGSPETIAASALAGFVTSFPRLRGQN